jgi:hypothetical protein
MWSKVKVASMVNCWFHPAIWSCREGSESKLRPIAAVRLPVQSCAFLDGTGSVSPAGRAAGRAGAALAVPAFSPRHALDPGLPRSQGDPAHGDAEPVQKLLEGLTFQVGTPIIGGDVITITNRDVQTVTVGINYLANWH